MFLFASASSSPYDLSDWYFSLWTSPCLRLFVVHSLSCHFHLLFLLTDKISRHYFALSLELSTFFLISFTPFFSAFSINNLYRSSLQLLRSFTSNLDPGWCYDSPRNLTLILCRKSLHISLRMLKKVRFHFPIECFWKSLYKFPRGTFQSMFLFPFDLSLFYYYYYFFLI